MNGIISPIERKQWFIDRIGKRVFRNRNTCDCEICEKTYTEGLIICDLQHACYLYDVECEYNREGIKIKYFDTKKEAEQFETK